MDDAMLCDDESRWLVPPIVEDDALGPDLLAGSRVDPAVVIGRQELDDHAIYAAAVEMIEHLREQGLSEATVLGAIGYCVQQALVQDFYDVARERQGLMDRGVMARARLQRDV